MYQAENIRAVLAGRGRGVRGLWPRVNRTVLLLGLTSLFTDISSEMVATILPLYLVYTLGFTPLQFGFIDGLYQGASALVRIASGLVGDRWSRHKEVAVLGYGLSAICKPAFLVVGAAWGVLVAIILVDRTGKGIRTAPRDALISLSTPKRAAGDGLRRAPRARHGGSDARAAAGVLRCWRSGPGTSSRSSSSASASRSSA